MSEKIDSRRRRAVEFARDRAVAARRAMQQVSRPYTAVLIVLAVVAIGSPHLVGVEPAPREAPPEAMPPTAPAEPVYSRAEVQRVIAELLGAQIEKKPGDAANPELDKALARVEKLAGAQAKAEKRVRKLEQAAKKASAAGKSAPASELNSRVYNVEARQKREEAAREKLAQDLLARVEKVEVRTDGSTAADVAEVRALRSRLDAIESRLNRLER